MKIVYGGYRADQFRDAGLKRLKHLRFSRHGEEVSLWYNPTGKEILIHEGYSTPHPHCADAEAVVVPPRGAIICTDEGDPGHLARYEIYRAGEAIPHAWDPPLYGEEISTWPFRGLR